MKARIPMQLYITCHGGPQADIPSASATGVRSRYPQDEAVGYRATILGGLSRMAFEPNPATQ